MVPLVLSLGVNEGRLTLRRACEVLSTNAAKVFGLYPNKGSLQVGTDADLTIVDLKATKRITADDLHYRVGWTPYEGMTVRGLPVATVVRGKIVARDGEFIGRNGPAVYIKR
jgi:dihydropyrimidinase